MIVFLNGKFVPEEEALVPVFDRGFLYGDGLFESLRVVRGKPFRWNDHIERLQRGAEFLRIRLPYSPDELLGFAKRLVEVNTLPDSLLRITLSRGIGQRGYSPKGADKPTFVMTLHPAPEIKTDNAPVWRIITDSFRLPANEPLARFKTANKLPQIMARAEADAAGADEALLLNTDGHVVEASSSNLFWIANGCVCTPPLESGILPGVTRLVVMELCAKLGLPAREENITPADLGKAEGAFLSLSSLGIVEIGSLDGEPLGRSPITAKLRVAYEAMLGA